MLYGGCFCEAPRTATYHYEFLQPAAELRVGNVKGMVNSHQPIQLEALFWHFRPLAAGRSSGFAEGRESLRSGNADVVIAHFEGSHMAAISASNGGSQRLSPK
jgi:hypothetical protein